MEQIWRHTPQDAVLLAYSVAQFVLTPLLASIWTGLPIAGKVAVFVFVAVTTAYNVIVVSHLFTHVPWFRSGRLNAVVSVLNSVNIGQSVQAYRFTHVRNHHRFNNDAPDGAGHTRDTSSTYRDGHAGEHAPLWRYALGGALASLLDRGTDVLRVVRLWRVGERETTLLSLATASRPRRDRELRQVRADRAAHGIALVAYLAISWQWTLICYLPAFFVALAMVNVQNYYRHYGADPSDRAADSVSHYGRLYNLLTFNDGYHQEHHLSPGAHWSRMPDVRERHRERLASRARIVSPVPAMLGFLHRRRPMLHRDAGIGRVP